MIDQNPVTVHVEYVFISVEDGKSEIYLLTETHKSGYIFS